MDWQTNIDKLAVKQSSKAETTSSQAHREKRSKNKHELPSWKRTVNHQLKKVRKAKRTRKRIRKTRKRKQKKDQEEKTVTEAGKQSEQPSGLEDKSTKKRKKKKKQKKTHFTSDHSIADTSMPTHEEKNLPKSLDSSAEPDASKDPTNRLSGDIEG
ncbi:hypothetical protein A2U01_0044301, partial [Trifolium medium]|nr:hypothetical protein [Trifolium medium]